MSTYVFASLMVMILAGMFAAVTVWLWIKDRDGLVFFTAAITVILVFVSWGIIVTNNLPQGG